MKLKTDKLPWAVILAGVLFTLYLQWLIKDETFFSGDGGLKFVLTKQLSLGNFRFDLDLPAVTWVRNLWESGLYPLGTEEPFIYRQFGRYYMPFPYTFPLVTAPLYAIFGFRGLYIIPLFSLWSIWIGFYIVCQRLKLGSAITAIALAILIFSSPLTMYSAMYWEHTLAVALAFYGVVTVLAPRSGELSRKEAIFSGVLIGLSVWFRGEFLCLVGIMCLLAFAASKLNFAFDLILLLSITIISLFIILRFQPLWFVGVMFLIVYAGTKVNFAFKNSLFFVISMFITVGLYWCSNILIYRHPLGIHALQVVENVSVRIRLNDALKYFKEMNLDLFYYFPIVFFPIIYIILSLFINKLKLTTKSKILLLIYTLFTFAVPILLPSDGGKQWGPRFLLILVPVISLLAIMTLQLATRFNRFGFKYIISGTFIALSIIGIYTNTYLGTLTLNENYSQSDVLNFLKVDRSEIVAVNHKYVSQLLASSLREKIFFRTQNEDEIVKLSKALVEQGYKEFNYICSPFNKPFSCKDVPPKLEYRVGNNQVTVEFSKVINNNISLYKASIKNA